MVLAGVSDGARLCFKSLVLMNMIIKSLCFAAVLALTSSCTDGKANDLVEDWPWEDPEDGGQTEPETSMTEPNQAYADMGWVNVSEEYGTLPEYINIYKSPSKLEGRKAVAYIAVADMKSAGWAVWSVKSDLTYKTDDSYKTPSEVYEAKKCPVVINGGYFFWSDGNYTSSLAASNGDVLAYNINYASEDWVSVYFPTRAAFLQKANGKFDACWTYVTSGGSHYVYTRPADNSFDKEPLEVPSASFPTYASAFDAETAIGGGPVLLDNGNVMNTWKEEMFDVGGVEPLSAHPRTAIGVTSDDKLVMFVCEGRNMTDGVAGLTTGEVAEVLKDLGCFEAINLDGGGSSCMLVNGYETIKPCGGSQRAVASAVIIL